MDALSSFLLQLVLVLFNQLFPSGGSMQRKEAQIMNLGGAPLLLMLPE
jgi:hypothetical protein